MTEIKENLANLPVPLENFILQWGDMGTQWGVNRSVSQIQALLFVTGEAMTAEEIAERLTMARSNVSNSLKELLAWNLIRRVPVRNDRRDHFEAEADVWEIAARIAAGRKQREIDPALLTLKSCVDQADNDTAVPEISRQRLKDMLSFTEQVDHWYGQMLSLPRSKRDMLLKLGSRIASFLPMNLRPGGK